MSSSSTSVLQDFRQAFPWSTGRSLREVLAQGERPDRATLIDWGTQLLEILAEAHAEGLLYRYLTEDQVFLAAEGRLFLAGCGSPGPLPGEPYTAQNDLYAAGCLLRRLAFASLRGGRGPGARDPLVKVLARATFPGPGAGYGSAAEMAAALREAGQAEVRTSPRRLDRQPGAGGRVARFPGTSPRRPFRPAAPEEPSQQGSEGALWHALALLVISLMLMTFLLVTGAVIVHQDAHPWRGGGFAPPLPPALAEH